MTGPAAVDHIGRGWIGVDLDGTLAHYEGWRGAEHIGAPLSPMIERVKAWLAAGWEVRIFTARVDGGVSALTAGDMAGAQEFLDTEAIRRPIEAWCLRHIGCVLPITNVKDGGMCELWDDRCVQVERNVGAPLRRPQPAPQGEYRSFAFQCAEAAIEKVIRERGRQDAKWGEQNHDPFAYLTILMEEVGEFAKAAAEAKWRDGLHAEMKCEAVHVAAVALAIVECLERDNWRWAE